MRLLFVTARPPWPGRRGDQARAAGWVRHLARRHEVRVVAQRWTGFPATGPPPGVDAELHAVDVPRAAVLGRLASGAAAGVLGLSDRPFQTTMFDHRRFRRAVAREAASFRPDVAVLVLSRVADVMPALGDVPAVVDLVDALALNMARRAERDPALGWLWRWESRRLARWDARLAAACRLATVVAERDRRSIVEAAPELADRVEVVPFGLELPDALPVRPATEPLVVTTGNLGYFPTVDGARWFAERVWPEVRRCRPEARWRLAGARPGRAVRDLARLPGVEVVADPDDLGALRRTAAVAVAPLRAGSGTPIKILEAMADGIPVVTTSGGAAGLDGVPADALDVVDDAEGFARAVSGSLADPARARSRAEAAWAWLRPRHGLDRVAARFEALLHRAAGPRGADAACPPAPPTPCAGASAGRDAPSARG